MLTVQAAPVVVAVVVNEPSLQPTPDTVTLRAFGALPGDAAGTAGAPAYPRANKTWS